MFRKRARAHPVLWGTLIGKKAFRVCRVRVRVCRATTAIWHSVLVRPLKGSLKSGGPLPLCHVDPTQYTHTHIQSSREHKAAFSWAALPLVQCRSYKRGVTMVTEFHQSAVSLFHSSVRTGMKIWGSQRRSSSIAGPFHN